MTTPATALLQAHGGGKEAGLAGVHSAVMPPDLEGTRCAVMGADPAGGHNAVKMMALLRADQVVAPEPADRH